MKPEEQRTAIAEFCGFAPGIEREAPFRKVWWKEGGCFCDCDLPDYLNDLNAIHEAVEKLKCGIDRFIWEMERLTKIGHRKDNCEHRPSDYLKLSQATSAQRAEALLRTIGKWSDHP